MESDGLSAAIPISTPNALFPPCRHLDKKNCSKCEKKHLSKKKFLKRAVYQSFKIDRTFHEQQQRKSLQIKIEPKNKLFLPKTTGIVPLTYYPFGNSPKPDYKCKFLHNWIEDKVKCKFLAVIAMYNETAEELHGTLEGILQNLPNFFDAKNSKKITPDQFGCVIILDGIEAFLKTCNQLNLTKLNKEECFRNNFTYFSQFFNLDVIKDEFMINDILKRSSKNKDKFELMETLEESGILNSDEEIVHCFSQQIPYEDYHLNLIFCVKQVNKRKLNTHIWFFEGFCPKINPEFILLLDVGTRPKPDGIYLLYKAMASDERISGCCGEIVPMSSGFNPIVLAQVVEYKFSHIFDKALESIIGFVSVLPGAFSAYRWSRINKKQVLEAYFKSQKPGQMSLTDANMYLAEDRILCLELMCQFGNNILRYVKGSVAETDVPSKLNELMAQRRRWINGSWFSSIYTIKNCNRISNSGHNQMRKCFFRLLMVYYTIIAFFNWILVGAFYVAFAISLKRNLDEESNTEDKLTKLSTPFIMLYVSIIICIIITSFAVKPKRVEFLYRIISGILGIYSYATIILTLLFIFRQGVEINSNWSDKLSASLLIAGAGMFAIIILLNWRNALYPVVKGSAAFIFLTGTYVNLFNIYAICNIHDCTWGNRPDKQTDEEKNSAKEYRNGRSRWVLVWIVSNGAVAIILNWMDGKGGQTSHIYVNMLALFVFGIIVLKFIGGLLYVLDEWMCCCFHVKKKL